MLALIVTTGAEFLFYLTNGVAIGIGMFLIPYLLVWATIMVFILLSSVLVNIVLVKLLLMFTVFFIFMIGISVPLAQIQMLTECFQFEQPYETENTSGKFTIKECKIKPNYFEDDFYWKSYVSN